MNASPAPEFPGDSFQREVRDLLRPHEGKIVERKLDDRPTGVGRRPEIEHALGAIEIPFARLVDLRQ